MLMEIYPIDELDKLDDWIEKISLGNKFMERLHEGVQKIKNKAQEQFWKWIDIIMSLALIFLKMSQKLSFRRYNSS